MNAVRGGIEARVQRPIHIEPYDVAECLPKRPLVVEKW